MPKSESFTLLDPSILAKANSAFNPLPIPKAAKPDHPFIKLLKRIRDFVIDIFNSFLDLFKPSPNLNQRQIEQMKEITAQLKKERGLNLINRSWSLVNLPMKPTTTPLKDDRAKKLAGLDLEEPKLPRIQIDSQNPTSKSLVDSMSLDSSFDFDKLPPLPHKNFDIPSSIAGSGMEGLYVQGQRVVNMATDVGYQEKAAPIVKSIQDGLVHAPDIIKTISDIGTVVGFKAFQPLYDKFANVEIQEKVDPEIKQLLSWLANKMPNNFQASLKQQILDLERKRNKEVDPNELDTYLTPLVAWIKSKHTDPVMSAYKGANGIEDEKVNAILQQAVRMLLEHKLDTFMKKFKDRVKIQLPIIVKAMMKENAQIISSGILERTISILGAMMSNTKLPFPTMVDSLIGVVHHHTNALIDVDAVRQRAIKGAQREIANSKTAARAYAEIQAKNAKKMAAAGTNAQNIERPKTAIEKSGETATEFLNELHLKGKRAYVEEAARDAEDIAAKKALMAAKEALEINKQIVANEEDKETPSTKAKAEAFLKRVSQIGEQKYLNEEIQNAKEQARQKAEKDAVAEYNKHTLPPRNETAKKDAYAFMRMISLKGEEAYAESEAKKVEAQPYANHSDSNSGDVCHPFIKELLTNPKAEDNRKKIYDDFADQIVKAFLPKQTVIALEERYKATIALNIHNLKPIFYKILTHVLTKQSVDVLNKDEGKLIDELYNMCKGWELGTSVGGEKPYEKFEKIIRPMLADINEKILRKAKAHFSPMSVNEVAEEMEKYLYPTVDAFDPKNAQKQREALLRKKQSGEVEVNQLAVIRSNLVLHDEIQKLVNDARKFAAEAITEGAKGDIKGLIKIGSEIFGPQIEKSATSWVEEKIRSEISTMIQEKVEQYTDPEKLNEMAGTVILPTVTKQLLQVFGTNLITKHLSTFAPHFKELALFEKDDKKAYKAKRTEIFNIIADELKIKSKDLLVLSKKDFEALTDEEYREIISPALAQIESHIEWSLSQRNQQKPEIQDIENAITAALNPKALEAESDKRLGALAYNALTKLGNFSDIEKTRNILLPISLGFFDLRDFIINKISNIASVSLQDIRATPHAIVDMATSKIEKQFPEENGINGDKDKLMKSNKEKLKEMMFGTPAMPQTKKEADKTRMAEIKKISKIACDFFVYQVEQHVQALSIPLPDALEKKAKTALIKKLKALIQPTMIETAITEIFKKTIGCNRLMNENLAIQCQWVIFSAIAEATERLQENSVPILVTSVPTLIPALV